MEKLNKEIIDNFEELKEEDLESISGGTDGYRTTVCKKCKQTIYFKTGADINAHVAVCPANPANQ